MLIHELAGGLTCVSGPMYKYTCFSREERRGGGGGLPAKGCIGTPAAVECPVRILLSDFQVSRAGEAASWAPCSWVTKSRQRQQEQSGTMPGCLQAWIITCRSRTALLVAKGVLWQGMWADPRLVQQSPSRQGRSLSSGGACQHWHCFSSSGQCPAHAADPPEVPTHATSGNLPICGLPVSRRLRSLASQGITLGSAPRPSSRCGSTSR